MSFTTSTRGKARIVALAGEIDMAAVPKVRQCLLEAVKSGAPVAVDLAAVTYMDSSGIAALVEGLQTARKQGTPFALAKAEGPVLGVLKLARLDKVFTLLPDLEQWDGLGL